MGRAAGQRQGHAGQRGPSSSHNDSSLSLSSLQATSVTKVPEESIAGEVMYVSKKLKNITLPTDSNTNSVAVKSKGGGKGKKAQDTVGAESAPASHAIKIGCMVLRLAAGDMVTISAEDNAQKKTKAGTAMLKQVQDIGIVEGSHVMCQHLAVGELAGQKVRKLVWNEEASSLDLCEGLMLSEEPSLDMYSSVDETYMLEPVVNKGGKEVSQALNMKGWLAKMSNVFSTGGRKQRTLYMVNQEADVTLTGPDLLEAALEITLYDRHLNVNLNVGDHVLFHNISCIYRKCYLWEEGALRVSAAY